MRNTISKFLFTLLLLTMGIGQVWGAETFTFSWTTAGNIAYCYSQAGPTGGELLTNNAIYFISSSTASSNATPTVETIDKKAYMNPQKTGFVFKPTSDVTLQALVQPNNANRNCTIYVDSISDTYAYAMYVGAGSASTKQDMCAYILANAADDTEKKWWYDNTNKKSITKSGNDYVAGTDGGAKKWLSGEQDPGEITGFAARKGNSVTALSSSTEATITVKTASKDPFVFKAGKVYRVVIVNSSNDKVALKSFTFTSSSPSCSAPAAPSISGTTSYTEGETIELTASTSGSNHTSTTTYAWYEGANWATASAADPVQVAATAASGGNVFSKTAALSDDGKKYWCLAANSTCTSHSDGTTISVAASSATKYDITYNEASLKGQSVTGYPTEYTEGVGVASFDALADVTDWHFTGWSPASIAADATGNKEITAQWVAAYDVTFDKGAATGTAPAAFQKWSGATFNLPGQGSMVAPNGKVFDGWKANGTGDKLAANSEYTMTAADVEFVAQWKSMPTTTFYYQSNISDAPALNATLSGTGGTLTTRSYKTSSPGSFSAQSISGYVSGTPDDMKAASGKKAIKMNNNDVYLKLALTSGKLQTGDTIIICGYGTIKMYKSITSGTGYNDEVCSLTMSGTGSNTFGVNTTACVIPQVDSEDVQYDSLCLTRNSNGYVTAIKVIRPAAREVVSTVVELTGASINDVALTSSEFTTLTTAEAYTFETATKYNEAPTVKFNKRTTVNYDEGDPKVTNQVISVTASEVSSKWQAQTTINTITYTIKTAKPATYAVTYNKGANGTGSIDSGVKAEDVAFTLSAGRFTRDGYVQTGWATEDGGAKAYDLGGSYTANEAITLYPFWTELDTYTAVLNSGNECANTAPAGWTFANAGTYGASDATAAYICKFGNTCPAPDSIHNDNFVAFAKSSSVYATYDLGITTTVGKVAGIFNVGSGSARTFTIDYLGSDGTTVKHTITINHPASSNWGRNTVNDETIVEDVRYIKIKGMTSNMSWIIMQAFSVKFMETRTKYDVEFAAGDGEGSMSTLKYIAGAEVTLPACTFTAPTSKEFDAWTVAKKVGSEAVEVTDGKFTMPAEAVVATATWKDEITRYTVAYYDGATKLGEEEVEAGENPADFATYQTKANYVFKGWYNNSDLAEEHKVANIAAEEINADAVYYGKWALDVQLTKLVFSNGFDAFIKDNTVKAYYMEGTSAPTMVSYQGVNLKDAADAVTVVGSKVRLVGTDDSVIELDLMLEAVTPMSSYDLQTFDGTESYVKTGNAYSTASGKYGWVFSKAVEEASNKRISEGKSRIYFFVGGSADRVTFTSGASNRAIKVYVNNEEVTSVTATAADGSTFDIPLDAAKANNMIAIVSNQTSGDGSVKDMKLNEHVISTDVTLSSLTVNGNAVDLSTGSLVGGVMTYKYELPYGTTDAPTVAAVANAAPYASVSDITVDGINKATFTVTAESSATQDYVVNFSVARHREFVIYDGGSSIDNPGSYPIGLAWTIKDPSSTSASSASSQTFEGKSYTQYINIFTSATKAPNAGDTRYMTITIPENYMAKFRLVGCGNGTGSRSLFISKEITSALDESIAFVTTSAATVTGMTSDLQLAGTYYLCADNSIRLYELSVSLYPIDYSRDLTQGQCGTICLPNGGVMAGAALFEIAYYQEESQKIFLDQIPSGEMIAGRPYIFLPNEDATQLAVSYTDAANAEAGHYHGLYGSYTTQSLERNANNYILINNQYCYVDDGGGKVGANRAYIKLTNEMPGYGVPNYHAAPPAAGRRRMAIGSNAPAVTTGMDELNAAEKPRKVLINGELFILRGEKMYDATGRLVK